METFNNNIEKLINDWYAFKEESLSKLSDSDKENLANFDDFSKDILNFIQDENKKIVRGKLDKIYGEFMDNLSYTNNKYYLEGFKDGIKLIIFGLK